MYTMSGRSERRLFVIESQPRQHAQPVVLDHRVADGDKVGEQFLAAGLGQVDSDAVLAEVERVEPAVAVPWVFARLALRVVAGAWGRPDASPGRVHPVYGLDLYDVGAHVGHQLGRVGARPDSGQVEYSYAFKGLSHFRVSP